MDYVRVDNELLELLGDIYPKTQFFGMIDFIQFVSEFLDGGLVQYVVMSHYVDV